MHFICEYCLDGYDFGYKLFILTHARYINHINTTMDHLSVQALVPIEKHCYI